MNNFARDSRRRGRFLIRAGAILSFLASEAFVAARLVVSRLPGAMNRKARLVTMPEFSHLSVAAPGKAKIFFELKNSLSRKIAGLQARQHVRNNFLPLLFIHVASAFRLARETREFTTVLFQHDGFSLHFLRRDEMWLARIANVIQEEIAKHGVETRLEWQL